MFSACFGVTSTSNFVDDTVEFFDSSLHGRMVLPEGFGIRLDLALELSHDKPWCPDFRPVRWRSAIIHGTAAQSSGPAASHCLGPDSSPTGTRLCAVIG